MSGRIDLLSPDYVYNSGMNFFRYTFQGFTVPRYASQVPYNPPYTYQFTFTGLESNTNPKNLVNVTLINVTSFLQPKIYL